MSGSPPDRRKVSREDLRRLFNDGQYWQRAQQGEFKLEIKRRMTSLAQVGEPPGTVSQIVVYRDESGRAVALVHQYVRSDGSLGGSGRPDPKELLVDGTLLYVS
jgi:hypothetical protein